MDQLIANNEKLDKPAVMFTFSLGGLADDTVPKGLACATDGFWFQLSDVNIGSGNLESQITHFFECVIDTQ